MRISDGMSIGRKLEIDKYRPSGFDFLRIILAAMVLIDHSWTIAEGEQAGADFWNQAWAFPLRFVLPAFFSLSGFLVSGSMERCRTLLNFLMLRGIRIYPALAIEVILSAFIIGPWVTTLPLRQYFTNKEFLIYLLNVTGDIHYKLPGVFHGNPKPDIVNWQLWTVPWELVCYTTLAVIIVIGVKKHRWLIGPAVLIGLVAAISRNLQAHGHLVILVGNVWGFDLVLYFLVGVGFFLYRNHIPRNGLLAALSLVIAWAAIALVPGGQYLALIPLVYVTMFLGTCNPGWRLPFGIADCSYGVYLYGYVIQQLIANRLPWSHKGLLNLALAFPLSVVAGMLSWHFLEKPIMNAARPQLKRIEDRWLQLLGH